MMNKFIKENKLTIILLISFITLLLVFIINKYKKEEIKQPKEEVTTKLVSSVNLEAKQKLKFEHYKTYNDIENKKVLIILKKTLSNYNNDFKYYILINDKKEELKIFSDKENIVILYLDTILNEDYKIIFENQNKKDDIQEYSCKISEVLKQDLSKITQEQYNKYEKLEHHILSILGANKILELKIKDKEKLLNYTEDKINTFYKNQDEENIKRFETEKDYLEKEIETLKSKKQEQDKELNTLYKEKEEVEKIFDKILGKLQNN